MFIVFVEDDPDEATAWLSLSLKPAFADILAPKRFPPLRQISDRTSISMF
jgi:hypothetical protein